MARPPPLPLQHQVAAAVRGARQGGAEVARIKIRKFFTGDIEIELETTLAPQLPPEPAEGEWDEFARAAAEKMRKPKRDAGGLTPLQRRIAEHAQKIR